MNQGNPENSNQAQLPAKSDVFSADLSKALQKIEEDLVKIFENQEKNASPEFNALMDGYVNKANETETLKVKYQNIEALYEEQKETLSDLREQTRKQKSDLEASRDALKASESDLHALQQEHTYYKQNSEERINTLMEEKKSLDAKLRTANEEIQTFDQKTETVRSELLEAHHQIKQLEKELELEKESFERKSRDEKNLIEELKEQLELRTRELEYKDALLNQLIKQAAADEKRAQTAIQQQAEHAREQVAMPTIKSSPAEFAERQIHKAKMTIDADEVVEGFEPVAQSLNVKPSAARWGAFRK